MNRFKKRALRVSICPGLCLIVYSSLYVIEIVGFFEWMLQVIAEHLSVEEVEIIKDMFTLMDTDKDGRVTYEELKAGLRKVGSQLAEPEIKMLMEVVS